MRVEIALYGGARGAVGAKSLERDLEDGATVDDLLAGLVEEYPDLRGPLVTSEGELQPSISLTVNGSALATLGGPETELEDGDRLVVAHSMRGG